MGSKRGKSYKDGGLRQGVGLVLEARAAVRAVRAKTFGDARESLRGLYGEIGLLIRRAAGNADPDRKRAASLTATLGRSLERLYGPAFSADRLRLMLRFSEVYPSEASRRALRGLRWSHVAALLALADVGERATYASVCLREGWSPERLRLEIMRRAPVRPGSSGRGADAKNANLDSRLGAGVLPPGLLEPSLDPDCAEFLGCSTGAGLGWREALVRSVEEHILGLGAGFCLLERHRRFQIGDDDFSLDLVFFHRGLRRLVAVACRTEPRPEGVPDPLPLYLLWLDQNVRQPGENAPAGLTLDPVAGPDRLALSCGDGSALPWYRSGLPPKAVLRAFFLQALAAAREGENGEG